MHECAAVDLNRTQNKRKRSSTNAQLRALNVHVGSTLHGTQCALPFPPAPARARLRPTLVTARTSVYRCGCAADAGEMKKGILTLMMYQMPLRGQLCLHSSANEDAQGSDVDVEE